MSINRLGTIKRVGELNTYIALVSAVTLVLKQQTLEKIILPLVAVVAGSLISGAFLHMIPAGISSYGNTTSFICGYFWASPFFCLEQFLHRRQCQHQTTDQRGP